MTLSAEPACLGSALGRPRRDAPLRPDVEVMQYVVEDAMEPTNSAGTDVASRPALENGGVGG